jgi:hypothetical protein
LQCPIQTSWITGIKFSYSSKLKKRATMRRSQATVTNEIKDVFFFHPCD